MDDGYDVRCWRGHPSVDTAELDDGRSAKGCCGRCGFVYWVDAREKKQMMIGLDLSTGSWFTACEVVSILHSIHYRPGRE